MSWSVVVWCIVIAIWIARSYYKAKRKREASAKVRQSRAQELPVEHQLEHEISLSEGDGTVDALREFLEKTTLSSFAQRNSSEEFVAESFVAPTEQTLTRTESDGQANPLPEEEGSFRTFYEEAENEGVAATVVKGDSAFEKPLSASPASQPFRLPDGQVFDLRMAMVYDVILHRRTTGFFSPRFRV